MLKLKLVIFLFLEKGIAEEIENSLRARAILLVFEKIYSCLFIPNCTRNHVITYTNNVANITFAEQKLTLLKSSK